MCGIVGMIGRTPVADRLLASLRRLEYRGYDSAGIATLEDGKLVRLRAQGKLKNLQERLAQQSLNGMIGIGHTRWATLGRPTEANAHPHTTDAAAVGCSTCATTSMTTCYRSRRTESTFLECAALL